MSGALLLLLIRIHQLELERDAWAELARRNTADWSREARAAWDEVDRLRGLA